MGKRFYLTDIGKSMVISALSGQYISFVNFALGEGILNNPTESELKERTSLVSPVPGLSNVAITSGIEQNSYIYLNGSFSSQTDFDLPDDRTTFKWSELGVYACGQGDDTFTGDGSETSFTLTKTTYMVYSIEITIGGNTSVVSKSDYTFNSGTNSVVFDTAPADGSTIKVYYPDTTTTQLFAYGYDPDAPYVKGTSAGFVENTYSIKTKINLGDSTSVTVKFDNSTQFAPSALFNSHIGDTNNPHSVKASQIDIVGYPGTSTVNAMKPTFTAPPSTVLSTDLEDLTSGDLFSDLFGKIAKAVSYLVDTVASHVVNTNNPHHVTLSSLGGIVPIDRGGTGSNGSSGSFSTFWDYLMYLNQPIRNSKGSINVRYYNVVPGTVTYDGTPYPYRISQSGNTKAVIILPYGGFEEPMAIRYGGNHKNPFGGIALEGYKCHTEYTIDHPNPGMDQWDEYTAILIDNANHVVNCGWLWDGSDAYVQTAVSGMRYYLISIDADKVYDFGSGTTPIN